MHYQMPCELNTNITLGQKVAQLQEADIRHLTDEGVEVSVGVEIHD